jgi:hypothetical protein
MCVYSNMFRNINAVWLRSMKEKTVDLFTHNCVANCVAPQKISVKCQLLDQ